MIFFSVTVFFFLDYAFWFMVNTDQIRAWKCFWLPTSSFYLCLQKISVYLYYQWKKSFMFFYIGKISINAYKLKIEPTILFICNFNSEFLTRQAQMIWKSHCFYTVIVFFIFLSTETVLVGSHSCKFLDRRQLNILSGPECESRQVWE